MFLATCKLFLSQKCKFDNSRKLTNVLLIMRISYFLILVGFFLVVSACGNRVIYYGREYPKTSGVTLYFRESEVEEPFVVMGKATMEVSVRRHSEKIQRKFVIKAQAKGADALLFDDIELTNTGSTTGGGAAGATVGRRGFLGMFGSKTKIDKGQLVKVSVLKYKKNIR